jgi:adenosylmethionine-8-amino-7-oxononanoate aminotransferase
MKKKIKSDDKKYIWHPFTKLSNDYDPLVISSAYDEKLVDVDGKEYIDLISSWWVNTHGHCRKEIISAITKQMEKFEQVLFADFTHQPATQLAEMLISILPKNLKKVFYSDNGSTSVEVAMKIAIQYWYNIGKKKKKKFVSMKGGYHGDTFGAMSVGFSSGFYKPYEDVLEKQFFTSYPEIWNGKNDIESIEKKALYDADDILNKYGGEIAALIIEPIIQGAAGMRICRKEFLDKFLQKFKDAGIIIIFDEVMTGFGRTGKMFASDYLSVKPDIMCLAKSLTGGYLPLAATIFSDHIHDNFFSDDLSKAFLHGHSYTANPIACAAAISSLKIFKEEKTIEKIKKISSIHKQCLEELSKKADVSKVRFIGSVAAFDYNKINKNYGSKDGEILKKKFLEKGLLLRPLGNTIYLMPPYCIDEKILYESYEKIIEILN